MGNSQDTGIFFSGTSTGPSFDLYMKTFSFASGWTRASSLIGDSASWTGWSDGDTVIGLGFVARGGMQIESAWYKIDFNGNGNWPLTGDIRDNAGRSTVLGALSVYQHSHQGFRSQDNRYTDMNPGSQSFKIGDSGFIRHYQALRGWAVQSGWSVDPHNPNNRYPLVSSTQFLINYTMLTDRNRLRTNLPGLPLAPLDLSRMKLQLGAYGFGPSGNRNYGQEAMLPPVPEPFTMSLLAGGLALAAIRKRKRKKS